jgi:hypothetical protein
MSVTVHVNTLSGGTLSTTATVSSPTADPNPGNNSATRIVFDPAPKAHHHKHHHHARAHSP